MMIDCIFSLKSITISNKMIPLHVEEKRASKYHSE